MRTFNKKTLLLGFPAPKKIGFAILASLYLLSLFGGFLAPYNHRSQAKDTPYLPPTGVHFFDTNHSFHTRPFIYRPRMLDKLNFGYEEDRAQIFPLQFLVRGDGYEVFGMIPANWHLVGVAENPLATADPVPQIHLLGTDGLGRDVLARLLYAGQLSLIIGPFGLLLAYVIGVSLGAISGYFGGVVDSILMRAAEIVMSLPTLILILAFRAAFPLSITPRQVAVMMVTIFAAVGWAEVSRLTRNLVLTERVQDYVTSAISLGANNWRVIAKHILPNVATPLLTQFALTAPVFILAEITLSFLGVGVQEPGASWGTLLESAKDIGVLKNYWWMLTPVIFVFLTALAFQLIGEREADSAAN